MKVKDGCAAHIAYQDQAKQPAAAKPGGKESKRKSEEEANGNKIARLEGDLSPKRREAAGGQGE